MSDKIALSKSRYCKGIQCPKILWMDKYKPEEAADVLSENIMANGEKVGDLAVVIMAPIAWLNTTATRA